MKALNMEEIAQRIKERREELSYSYQDLATKTGMSKSTLQRYETGAIKNIPLDKLDDLANALEIEPEYLLGWDKEAPADNEVAGAYRAILQDYLKGEPTPEQVESFKKALPILFEGFAGINKKSD